LHLFIAKLNGFPNLPRHCIFIPILPHSTHLDPHTILPEDLPLLLAYQSHRAPHIRSDQVAQIKRIYDRRNRARCGPAALVRLRRKRDEHEDGEDGHFAREDQRREARVDVVVREILRGLENVVA
jgi:hypothetical protein